MSMRVVEITDQSACSRHPQQVHPHNRLADPAHWGMWDIRATHPWPPRLCCGACTVSMVSLLGRYVSCVACAVTGSV